MARTTAGELPAAPDTGTPEPPWHTELHRIAYAFSAVAQDHPRLLRALAVPVARRPAPLLQLTEHILAVLFRAGFDEATTLTIHRAFVAWIPGCRLVDGRQVVDDPEEPDPAVRLGLHRLPAAAYPRLRALVPRMAEYDGEQEMTAGLDSLLGRMPRAPLDAFYGRSAP
ncbi:TetR/AcrR family transcriptional regulator C-terminal domain-containing protein [Streptomyces asoensis]|uniref:TetR/AcrR family transcriptional regulator C-terminal domain-containing protein n=1 Tax=Streptomyces asoensis TaxID=249586 RepID=UPI00340D420D